MRSRAAQAVDRELQAPEPIAFVGIGAAEIEHQIGPMRVEDARQVLGERGEILLVAGAVLEGDVEVADFLPERKVVRAVQREREHRGLVPEDGGGAVALVHVAVDDRRARDGALAQQHGRRDRDVVEHAVAFAAIAEGVMRPAGEVGGDLWRALATMSARSIRATSRAAASVAPTDRLDRSTIISDHGNPIRRCASGGSVPRRDRVDVRGIVDQPQLVPRDRVGDLQVAGGERRRRR